MDLNQIKTVIEGLEPRHHLMIGAILKKNPHVKLNDSKNGILVNLSVIPESAIEEIKKYLDYIKDQEKTLTEIEGETEEYKQFISEKDNKDKFDIPSNTQSSFPHLI
jgi:hypothetical protein